MYLLAPSADYQTTYQLVLLARASPLRGTVSRRIAVSGSTRSRSRSSTSCSRCVCYSARIVWCMPARRVLSLTADRECSSKCVDHCKVQKTDQNTVFSFTRGASNSMSSSSVRTIRRRGSSRMVSDDEWGPGVQTTSKKHEHALCVSDVLNLDQFSSSSRRPIRTWQVDHGQHHLCIPPRRYQRQVRAGRANQADDRDSGRVS